MQWAANLLFVCWFWFLHHVSGKEIEVVCFAASVGWWNLLLLQVKGGFYR